MCSKHNRKYYEQFKTATHKGLAEKNICYYFKYKFFYVIIQNADLVFNIFQEEQNYCREQAGRNDKYVTSGCTI